MKDHIITCLVIVGTSIGLMWFYGLRHQGTCYVNDTPVQVRDTANCL